MRCPIVAFQGEELKQFMSRVIQLLNGRRADCDCFSCRPNCPLKSVPSESAGEDEMEQELTEAESVQVGLLRISKACKQEGTELRRGARTTPYSCKGSESAEKAGSAQMEQATHEESALPSFTRHTWGMRLQEMLWGGAFTELSWINCSQRLLEVFWGGGVLLSPCSGTYLEHKRASLNCQLFVLPLCCALDHHTDGSSSYKQHRPTPSSSSTLPFTSRDEDDSMVGALRRREMARLGMDALAVSLTRFQVTNSSLLFPTPSSPTLYIC
ncbi:E3 ubiquitin-protein ligase TRAF7, partial [Ophiophagus hannah]